MEELIRIDSIRAEELISYVNDKPIFEPENNDMKKALEVENYKRRLNIWFQSVLSEFNYWVQVELLASRGDFKTRLFLHENATRTELAETLLSQKI